VFPEQVLELEARTAKLPDPVKARFREDPEISSLLESLRTWAEGNPEPTTQALMDLEEKEAGLVTVWGDKLRKAELEVKITGSGGKDPFCRFCGASFALPQPGTERAQWARLRGHVAKLHPKEWAALEG
jgi:hypothetical protein